MRQRVQLAEPRRVSDTLALGEDITTYHAQRVKVAVVVIGGKRSVLTIGDTTRCAEDPEAAKATLENVAQAAGVKAGMVKTMAAELQAHCQGLVGKKKEIPDYGR